MRFTKLALEIFIGFVFVLVAAGVQSQLSSFAQLKPFTYWIWVAWFVCGGLLVSHTLQSRSTATNVVEDQQPSSSDSKLPLTSDREGEVWEKAPTTHNTQDQLIEANSLRKFSKPEWIDSRDKSGRLDPALPKTSLQRKLPDSTPPGVISEHVVLTTPNLDQIEFIYAILFNDKSWKAGEYHLLEGESPSGIGPEKVLNSTFFREQTRHSKRLICIGLASTEFKPEQLDTNTVLSDNRAIYLCSTLFKIGIVQFGSEVRAAYAMGLGEYFPPQGDTTSNRMQRAALIVSIKSWNEESDQVVLDGIKAAVATKGIQLRNYSRDDDLPYRIFLVQGPEFLPADSPEWDSSGSEHFIRDAK